MSFFTNLVGGGGGGRPERAPMVKPKSEVDVKAEKLLQQIQLATLAEDKRQALTDLKELAQKNPNLQLGVAGLKQLMDLTRRSGSGSGAAGATAASAPNKTGGSGEGAVHDKDVTKSVLDILEALIIKGSSNADGTAGDASESENTTVVQFITAQVSGEKTKEIKTYPNVTRLLEICNEPERVIRFYGVNLLTALVMNKPDKMQNIILGEPMGVNTIMDLLDDRREIIRNAVLMCLDALTANNRNIQSIVAFGGGYDKLLTIAINEGGLADGTVIVEDCLRLLNNLLKENPNNQMLFRDHIARLRELLVLPKGATPENPLKPVTLVILSLVLDIIKQLVSSVDSLPGKETVKARTSLGVLLAPLLYLSYCDDRVIPIRFRRECLSLVAPIVDEHKFNQEVLAGALCYLPIAPNQPPIVPPKQPHKKLAEEKGERSAIRYLLELSLNSSDPWDATLSEFGMRCFLSRNRTGQLSFAATFMPLPSSVDSSFRNPGKEKETSPAATVAAPPPYGHVLLQSLLALFVPLPAPPTDGSVAIFAVPINPLQRVCRAMKLVTYLIRDSEDCKEMLVKLPLEMPEPNAVAPPRLIDKCLDVFLATRVTPTPGGYLECLCLLLLCEWMNRCVSAVDIIFSKPNALDYFIALATSDNSTASVHMRGLATFALAVCLDLTGATMTPPPAAGGADGAAAGAATAGTPFPYSTSLPPQLLLDVLTQRITTDRFTANLDQLMATPDFAAAEKLNSLRSANPLALTPSALQSTQLEMKHLEPPATPPAFYLYDAPFTALFRSIKGQSDKRLLSLFSKAKSLPPAPAPTSAPASTPVPAPIVTTPVVTPHTAASSTSPPSTTAAATSFYSNPTPPAVAPAADTKSYAPAPAAAATSYHPNRPLPSTNSGSYGQPAYPSAASHQTNANAGGNYYGPSDRERSLENKLSFVEAESAKLRDDLMRLKNQLLEGQSSKDERIGALEQENARLRKQLLLSENSHSSFQSQLQLSERAKLQLEREIQSKDDDINRLTLQVREMERKFHQHETETRKASLHAPNVTVLMKKYLELQETHEDLLILLASYDVDNTNSTLSNANTTAAGNGTTDYSTAAGASTSNSSSGTPHYQSGAAVASAGLNLNGYGKPLPQSPAPTTGPSPFSPPLLTPPVHHTTTTAAPYSGPYNNSNNGARSAGTATAAGSSSLPASALAAQAAAQPRSKPTAADAAADESFEWKPQSLQFDAHASRPHSHTHELP